MKISPIKPPGEKNDSMNFPGSEFRSTRKPVGIRWLHRSWSHTSFATVEKGPFNISLRYSESNCLDLINVHMVVCRFVCEQLMCCFGS